jgi:hypothetical protein
LQSLLGALYELPSRRRRIFIAARLEESPHLEIAERFGISTRMVEKELKAALTHCANRLQRKVIQRFGPGAENRLDQYTAETSRQAVDTMTPHPLPDSSLHSQAQDWLLLLTSGRATVADGRALRAWCAEPEHAEAFEAVCRLWRQLEPAALQASQVVPLRSFRRRALLGGAIAASAAWVLVRGGGLLGGPSADLQTAVGEQRHVQLAQGIDLELNTQTRVSVQGERLHLLEGELQVGQRADAGPGRWGVAQRATGLVQPASGGRPRMPELPGRAGTPAVAGRSQLLDSGKQLVYDPNQVGQPQAFDALEVMAWRERCWCSMMRPWRG